jgi:Flp pilus assembly protein TadG
MVEHLKRGRQHGQALVELGIVIVLIVTLAMGIIEFGRAFMIINMVTNAAREGARTASVMQDNNGRDATTKCITAGGQATITSMVQSQVNNVSNTSVTVTTSQCCAISGGVSIPAVKVQVAGHLSYIFNLPLVGTGFDFSRSITFGDEGRAACAPCGAAAC